MPSKKSSQFLSVSQSLSWSLSWSLSQSLRRAVVSVLCVAALVGAVLLPVAPANAATRFTNGERMEGSFFDHLADGLAGDPDGGDGVSGPEPQTSISTQQQQQPLVITWKAKLAELFENLGIRFLTRLAVARGGAQ